MKIKKTLKRLMIKVFYEKKYPPKPLGTIIYYMTSYYIIIGYGKASYDEYPEKAYKLYNLLTGDKREWTPYYSLHPEYDDDKKLIR